MLNAQMKTNTKTLVNRFWAVGLILSTSLFCCQSSNHKDEDEEKLLPHERAEPTPSKPFARYWWFASEIKKEDVRFNLDWLRQNGFGGVELAWVYPHNRKNTNLTDKYTPRQEWLTPEWRAIVAYTIEYADSIGLACDLTMGTLWPFGDSYVPYERASQHYGKKERQKIVYSWEHPKEGYVIDHINPKHYLPYLNRMMQSFPQPETQLRQAYFIDSWEVETERLWTDGLGDEFQKRFGYDVTPFMNDLHDEANKGELYDYRSLISEKVIGFYQDFDSLLNANDILSRGQCSGAPADIISAYACLDIPEGESMLYEPEYNSIPASAALLSGKKTVSAESFTCLYGWPADYMREEQTADLKLVADALFANGVNKIIWHGKAHNRIGADSSNFYATVHLGDQGALADELPAFNEYLIKVSSKMASGKTYSDVAVYLPTEDAWIKGVMPKEKQFIWAKEYYEMRYVYFPEEVVGHHPIWINYEFLEKAVWENGHLVVGDASFASLYVDVQYLDRKVLNRIKDLAEEGLPVTLKQTPVQAGRIQDEEWNAMLDTLRALPNVFAEFDPLATSLVTGKNIPPYWARETDESLLLFFAHPNCRQLKFPLNYGQSYADNIIDVPVSIHHRNQDHRLNLSFSPQQSLLYEIKDGRVKQIDISFQPKTPVVEERPPNFAAPWLVE